MAFLEGLAESCAKIIKKEKKTRKPIRADRLKCPTGNVMISYTASSSKIVLKLNDKLIAAGLSVWIIKSESDRCDVPISSSTEIDRADIVLICYSSAYRKSAARRWEAMYASEWKKAAQVIFVRVEKNYVPDGWLRKLQGKSEYYDVTTQFGTTCDLLIKHISRIYDRFLEMDQQPLPINSLIF